MSLWSTVVTKLKGIFNRMIGTRTLEQVLHITPFISSKMEQSIKLWSLMYENAAPWLQEPTYNDPTRIASLGLPSMIASEKARTALLEFKSEISVPVEEIEEPNPDYKPDEKKAYNIQPETITVEKPLGDSSRAEYLEKQYKKLKKQLREQIEYGIAKGGLVIKPYVTGEGEAIEIEFDYIQAENFYPIAFDANNNITEAVFIQTKVEKDIIYRRIEYHKLTLNGVEITNKAFKSTNNQTQGDTSGVDLGQEISLKEVPEWKELLPRAAIGGVDRPLFAYFKMPEANTTDTSSPLGVSGFSRAVDLIKDADMQYSRVLWEFEAGEMAIDIDRTALNHVIDGEGNPHSVMNHLQRRLFRTLDMTNGDTYNQFAPALRSQEYLDGLNAILMRIEDVTAMSRGTLSDASAEARTATEIKILKQRSFQANADIQAAIQECLENVIYVMNAYCDLYNITPDGQYDVSFEWDDSIIVDVDTELNKMITLMERGILSKLEVRMWYKGETKRQAEQALMEIESESLRSVEREAMLDYE